MPAADDAPYRRRSLFLRTVDRISSVAGVTAAVMLVGAVVVTCQMIFVRFVLNGSTIWQTETIIYLMIGSTLFGLPYVQNKRGHVAVDAVLLVLSYRGRRRLTAATLIVSLVVIGIMVFYGAGFRHLAWTRNWTSDTVWGAPLWVPYLGIPIGLGLYFLQMAADLYEVLVEQSGKPHLEIPHHADGGSRD